MHTRAQSKDCARVAYIKSVQVFGISHSHGFAQTHLPHV